MEEKKENLNPNRIHCKLFFICPFRQFDSGRARAGGGDKKKTKLSHRWNNGMKISSRNIYFFTCSHNNDVCWQEQQWKWKWKWKRKKKSKKKTVSLILNNKDRVDWTNFITCSFLSEFNMHPHICVIDGFNL